MDDLPAAWRTVYIVKMGALLLGVVSLAAAAISVVVASLAPEPPLPHERTLVCEDGTVLLPRQGGCADYGGLDHWETTSPEDLRSVSPQVVTCNDGTVEFVGVGCDYNGGIDHLGR